MHLGNLSLSGAGMLVIEATGVTAQGRISLTAAPAFIRMPTKRR